ncbi:hypothetical protein ANO11243_055830 [Dothideomycetidae sp. 11243]|nr:hypothetical protein ANO11243_055830 [fungal sp. No.11243]
MEHEGGLQSDQVVTRRRIEDQPDTKYRRALYSTHPAACPGLQLDDAVAASRSVSHDRDTVAAVSAPENHELLVERYLENIQRDTQSRRLAFDVSTLCDRCTTSYLWEVGKTKGQPNIKISCWHDVGALQSPFDSEWVTLLTMPQQPAPASSAILERSRGLKSRFENVTSSM